MGFTKRVPHYSTKMMQSFLAFWIAILRLKSKRSWQPKLVVEKHIKSDIAAGLSTPSARHFALEIIFSWGQSDKITPEQLVKFTDNPLLSFIKSGNCNQHRKEIINGDVKVEVVELTSAKSRGESNNSVIVYTHGGGYFGASAVTFNGFVAKLSVATSTTVVSVDYGLCPSQPLTETLRQCSAVVQHYKEKGHDVILAGDSAGGGLCVGTIQHLVQNGLQQIIPEAAVLISPFVDVAGEGESYEKNILSDKMVSPVTLKMTRDWATPPGIPSSDPRVSFVNGSFEGFPPIYITVSETEMLYSDSVSVCEKVRANGGEVTFEAMPYGVHDFPLLGDFVPEYQASFERICNFIKGKIKHS